MPSVDNRVVRMEFDNASFERRLNQTMHSLAQLNQALKLTGANKALTDVGKSAGFLDKAMKFTQGKKGLTDTSKAASDLNKSLNLEGGRRGLNETAKAAGNLDKSLKLDGAKKSIAEVNRAANSVDVSPIKTSLSGVGAGFVAMSTIAITALATITNAAITAGVTITKALSFDLALDGFREYETKMGSIQTILSNTARYGTTLEEVTTVLDDLNAYADQTIYNFGQMTKNIGLFTNAGIRVEDAADMIKGFSNEAAASGTNAEGAASAAYQLSQALSAGTVRLMDWRSLQNVGMGNKNMQNGIIEIADAMGTMSEKGTSAEEVQKDFNGSLEKGWLSADVMSTYLKIMAGEMTEAEMAAIGLDDATIEMFTKQQQMAEDAATKVRTLTQLIGTVKESIGSSWAETFNLVFGDFNEATELFTGVNNAVGGFVKKNAEHRNAILQTWKDFGGRDRLIKGLKDGFSALGDVLGAVRDGFRDVFPATTAEDLIHLTDRFADFMNRVKPMQRTLDNIKSAFRGFFSALAIGWDILKAGVGFIKDLFLEITGFSGGGILEEAGNIGDFFTNLRESLDKGEAIKEWFDDLFDKLKGPLEKIAELREGINDFFNGLGQGASAAAGEVQSWWDPFLDFGERILDVLDNAGEKIAEWFKGLMGDIAEAIDPGEADVVLDALNTSLLGGIAFMIGKWLKEGINLDFGGGVLENVTNVLEELTGTLQAMQTNLKADALMNIAIAIGVLTASLVVLSILDPEALSRALGAMAAGFTQLMIAFAVLQGMNAGIWDGTVFATIAGGMILMAGAVVVLSGAVAILSQLSWTELAKGLGAVTLLLGALTGSAVLLSKFSGGILLSSIALNAIAGAIVVLSGAVLLMSGLSWTELAKGLGAVAVMLGVLIGAAVLISKFASSFVFASVAITLMASALLILSQAVQTLGGMSLEELAKGIGATAIMLGILVGAAYLISENIFGILSASAAILILSIALNVMADAIQQMGGMSWEEIAKGLVAMAGGLLILVVAANAASGAVGGAIAMGILAGSLILLAEALKVIGDLSVGQIAAGLITLALAFGIFLVAGFLAEKVSVGILALGASMLLVGASFALFGIGIEKVVNALIKFGEHSEDAYEGAKTLGKAIPALLVGFAEGVIAFGLTLLKYIPQIVEILGKLLGAVLDAIADVLPKVGELFLTLIETILTVITKAYPQIIAAGIGIIIALLTGIKENIGEIVTLVLEIMVAFLEAIAANLDAVILAGAGVLVAFIEGLIEAIDMIAEAVTNLITAFLTAIGGYLATIVGAGLTVLTEFLRGMTDNISKVIGAVGTLIVTFIGAVAGLATRIAQAGTDALVKFLEGMTTNLAKIVVAVSTLITTFISSVGGAAERIATAGAGAIINFVKGLGRNLTQVVTAGVTVILNFLNGLASQAIRLADGAAGVLITFLNALADVIRRRSGELRSAGANIAAAIIDGATGGLASKAKSFAEDVVGFVKSGWDAAKGFLGMSSPSKLFMTMGVAIGDGVIIGMEKSESKVASAGTSLAKSAVDSFRHILSSAVDAIEESPEFNPTITPVLDLTRVQADAKAINGYLPDQGLAPVTSLNQARVIASTSTPVEDADVDASGVPGGVTFEQNIYAPKQLSTADIYRQTRNQITLAKEELNVA